ncbi:retrotransposon protein, putative, ty1-copia subclass, partial [Tanacetum coccineum]
AGELNASVDEKDSLAQVWYKSLGHISEAGLHVLEKKGLFCRESLGGYGFIFSGSNTRHLKSSKSGSTLKCVLLGYLEGVKGYRLYRLDNESPKIVTSRNMVIDESVMYKDTLKDSDASADKSVEELQTPDLTDYQLVRDRELMTRTKPLRFRDESNMVAYAFTTSEEEDTHGPLTYQEAAACEDISEWKTSMKEDMDSLRNNKTWELVDHPARQKLLEQLDVKTVFLHRNLEEVIYMRQPSGYEEGNKVCLLKKSLYGLKSSPRKWYRRFDEYMLSNQFKHNSYDRCIYYKSYAQGEYIYLFMLIACKSKVEIGSTKSLLKRSST